MGGIRNKNGTFDIRLLTFKSANNSNLCIPEMNFYSTQSPILKETLKEFSFDFRKADL